MEKEDAETYALIEWVGQDNIWLKVKDWSFKIALSSVRRNKYSDLRIIKSCCSKGFYWKRFTPTRYNK